MMTDAQFYMKLGYSLALDDAFKSVSKTETPLREILKLKESGAQRISDLLNKEIEETKEEEPLFI